MDDTRPAGFSAYVCIGRNGGWKIRRDGRAFRFNFGCVAFCVMGYDIEEWVGAVLEIERGEKPRRERDNG